MTEHTSPLDIANKLLEPLIPRVLEAFAKVRPGKPPQSFRALGPLAFVLTCEALGLAYLLTDEQRRAAWAAARPPGRSKAEPAYDPTNDSDEQRRAAWAAARADALETAYQVARKAELVKAYEAYCADWQSRKKPDGSTSSTISKVEFERTLFKEPDRVEFERQWGERNPIDESMVPHAFDARAQISLLDAVTSNDDWTLGAFVSEQRIRAGTHTLVSYDGHTLDFVAARSLEAVASLALRHGWIAYYDVRGAVVGVRLLPPSEGVRLRLRSPLANIAPMHVTLPPPPDLSAPAFLSLTRLKTGTCSVEVGGLRLDLHGCHIPTSAASRALAAGWGCVPAIRDGLHGLLFHPPPDGWVGVAASFKPVCPRCLDVVPGVPAGDPDSPHPGPFAPEVCTPCALNTSEPIPSFLAEPHAAPSSELPDPSPNFPPSDFFDNQPEPAEDPAPSEKPAPSPPVKRGRGRPKGSKSGARPLPAESAICKSGKRARS